MASNSKEPPHIHTATTGMHVSPGAASRCRNEGSFEPIHDGKVFDTLLRTGEHCKEIQCNDGNASLYARSGNGNEAANPNAIPNPKSLDPQQISISPNESSNSVHLAAETFERSQQQPPALQEYVRRVGDEQQMCWQNTSDHWSQLAASTVDGHASPQQERILFRTSSANDARFPAIFPHVRSVASQPDPELEKEVKQKRAVPDCQSSGRKRVTESKLSEEVQSLKKNELQDVKKEMRNALLYLGYSTDQAEQYILHCGIYNDLWKEASTIEEAVQKAGRPTTSSATECEEVSEEASDQKCPINFNTLDNENGSMEAGSDDSIKEEVVRTSQEQVKEGKQGTVTSAAALHWAMNGNIATGTKDTPLWDFLVQYCDTPYVNDQQANELAQRTGRTVQQVKTWFSNARQRSYRQVLMELDEEVNGTVRK